MRSALVRGILCCSAMIGAVACSGDEPGDTQGAGGSASSSGGSGGTSTGGRGAGGGFSGGTAGSSGLGGASAGGATASTGGQSSGGLPATSGGSAGGTTPSSGGSGAGGSSGGFTGTLSGGSPSGGASSGGVSGAASGGASKGGAVGSGGTTMGGAPSSGGMMGFGGAGKGGAPTGGSGTGGKASGGSSSGGSGSGGSSAGCNVQPVTKNATQAAQRVLCYLYSIYRQSTLSGVQDCSWSPQDDVGYVNQTTGVYPAIVGGDFLYTDAVPSALAAWNAGSLPMIRYHMGRPEDADSYQSSLGTTDLADTLRQGSSRYNGLLSKFEHAASELLRLQASGVVVLWAPFHEAQPGGWFWWSKGTGDQYKQLWTLLFDYLAQRGVNNVIWLMPFSGSPASSFYPGKAMVDFAGPDTYADGQPFASNFRAAVSAVGNDAMPIALHETGYVPNPADMFSNNQAPFVLFSVWCSGDWLQSTSKNSAAELRAAFTHARTLNRGELPRF